MATILDSMTITFFREIVPFNELPHEVLQDLLGKILIKTFPKGTLVLEQDGVPCEYLYIIQKGAVEKIVQREGKDVLLDYRAEGEFFGSASLITGSGSAFSVRTHEDTVCYLIPKDVFDHYSESKNKKRKIRSRLYTMTLLLKIRNSER